MKILTLIRTMLSSQNSRRGAWKLPLAMAGIAVLVLAYRLDTFLSSQNLSNLFAQATPLIIASLGQLMVVLIGGLDLSIGAVISLTTSLLVIDAPPYLILPIVFLAAALVGLTNGIAVARFNVHPIIATLSVMSIVQGIALLIRPVAGGVVPPMVTRLVSGDLFGIPMAFLWVLGIIAIGWKVVHASRYGLHLFAVGGGPAIANSYGISVQRITISAYVFASTFAATAGVFLAGRIGSGDPKIGDLFAVESITAVALGGVQLAGGVGSVAGALTGSVVLSLLANSMNLENISAFVQTVVKGLILLLVVAMQPRKNIGL
jgi:ribose transport system permease protein